MKKVLFATTALIATAGVASADIALSGDGRMGLSYTENATNVDNETTFSSRLRIAFTASGVTDGGISFGGSVRSEQNGATGTAGSVYVSGTFGKITMGDVVGANESATGDLAGVGYTGAGSSSDITYIVDAASATQDTGVAYSYSVNGLTIYAGAGQRQAASANNSESFGISYTAGGFTLGAGAASVGNVDETSVSLRTTMGAASITAIYRDEDNGATIDTESGVSVVYAVDSALSLTAFLKSIDNLTAVDQDYTGIGFAYNLGGGATLAGGYVDGGANGNNLDTMDFGIKFAF